MPRFSSLIYNEYHQILGDFLLSRDDNSNFILSVKSKEKGNPVVHFTIEWLETRQVKGDRNNYYRVKGTLLQDHNIFGLIQQHRKSKVIASDAGY